MNIELRVVARAKKNLVKQEGLNWKVYTSAPAENGRANEAVIALLSGHFGVARSKIEIIKGLHSRNKIAKIPTK